MSSLIDILKIGDFVLRNRIVMPPMHSGLATEKGSVTNELVDHYVRRSKALGILIVEHSYVDVEGKLGKNQVGIYDEELVPGLFKLSSSIKAEGPVVVLQINHAGSRTSSEVTGVKSVSSSTTNGARGLEVDEIKVLVRKFAQAAEWGIQAGFDGIEVHGAHGFLLNQFTSPLTNHRTDKYGGNFENRIRFPLEVVREVKKKVGNKLLLYRLGSDDLDPYGIQIEDSQKFALQLEEIGVDIVDVSGGICGSRPKRHQEVQGYFIPQASQIKKVVDVPVIGVGGIKDPRFANQLIKEEKVDLVAVGRQLLADPNWAIKVVELFR